MYVCMFVSDVNKDGCLHFSEVKNQVNEHKFFTQLINERNAIELKLLLEIRKEKEIEINRVLD